MDNARSTKEPAVDITIIAVIVSVSIIGIVLLSLCIWQCLRLARKAGKKRAQTAILIIDNHPILDHKIPESNEKKSSCQKEHFNNDRSSQRLHECLDQMMEGRFVEDEPSLTPNCQIGSKAVLSDIGNLSCIPSLNKNGDDASAVSMDFLRTMIIEDVSSSSYLLTSDEIGEDSKVFVKLSNGHKMVMKYPSGEIVSISGNSQEQPDEMNWPTDEERLFNVEHYSPMHQEENIKFEESETSGVFSTSLVYMRPKQYMSRSYNSRSKAQTVTISGSLLPVSFDTFSCVINSNGEAVSIEEEDEDKPSYVPSVSRHYHTVSIDSKILANTAPTSQTKHKDHLVIPNTSHSSRRSLNLTLQNSKNNIFERKTKATSNDEAPIVRHNPKVQPRGEQLEYPSVKKVSMKLLTTSLSQSLQLLKDEKRTNRPSEAKQFLSYPTIS